MPNNQMIIEFYAFELAKKKTFKYLIINNLVKFNIKITIYDIINYIK